MHFIRENMFLVCVIAAVVVIGGIMVFMEFNWSAEVDGQLARRRALADSLKRLGDQATKQPVNQKVVTAAKKQVEDIRNLAKQIREDCLDWNRSRYQVMTREITENNQKIQVPLFPIDEERFRLHALRYNFQEVYRKELDKLLAELEPIVPPTPAEIVQKANVWNSELTKYRERMRLIQARESREGTGAAVRPPGMGEMPMEGPMPMAPRGALPVAPVDPRGAGARGGPLSGADAEAIDLFGPDFVVGTVPNIAGMPTNKLASYLGFMSARRDRATEGNIYASRDSLDPVFAWGSTITAPQDRLLWHSQVNLWVTQDILRAISQTNKAATQTLPENVPPCVLVLPIKRLVRMDITEEIGSPMRPGMIGGGPRGEGMMMGDPTMMGMEGGYGGPAPAAKPGPAVAHSLTQRVATTEYDVVRYQVTLIMRLEYLKKLQVYLLASNYHTITQIALRDFRQPQQTAKADPNAELYYYGNEPVIEVTIEGELMLLTPWLRGKRDPEKKVWDPQFPPLMPVQVLNDLPVNAQRPEDVQRLAEARSSVVR